MKNRLKEFDKKAKSGFKLKTDETSDLDGWLKIAVADINNKLQLMLNTLKELRQDYELPEVGHAELEELPNDKKVLINVFLERLEKLGSEAGVEKVQKLENLGQPQVKRRGFSGTGLSSSTVQELINGTNRVKAVVDALIRLGAADSRNIKY